MNILFLFYAPMLPYVGGIQRVSENLAREMTKRGHCVFFLSINSEEKNTNYAYPVPQFFLDETLDKQSYIESYRQLLLDNDINVVINQEPREDLLVLLNNTPKGIKRITCFHTQPFLSQGKTRQIMRYYKPKGVKAWLYRNICKLFPVYHSRQMLRLEKRVFEKTLSVSELLCFESGYYCSRVEKYMPFIDRRKLVSVCNPNSCPILEKNGIQKEKMVLWVGRQINTPKNVPAFIDFWTIFRKRNPDWRACVVGVGPDLEYNKRYAMQKKTQGLEFLGRVEDVSFFYEKATFFVSTSMYEGFPMVLLEAMNKGCIPCAFDTYESLHDIIDDDVNGIIVPDRDTEQLVCRIEGILAEKPVLHLMRHAAIQKSSCFDVEKIVDKWESILAEL